jgi:hypothetical protein
MAWVINSPQISQAHQTPLGGSITHSSMPESSRQCANLTQACALWGGGERRREEGGGGVLFAKGTEYKWAGASSSLDSPKHPPS